MYSEIKYDGERVQLHKQGKDFKYFSRSLKPVMPHKVKHFAEHIPKAFPGGSDMILDAEVLMVDNKTGKPHWLKVKKDYLNEGAMADSADLVVLGGWYGTGNKGGLISIFLMGCHDQFADRL